MVAIEAARAKGASDFSDIRAPIVMDGEDDVDAKLTGAASQFLGKWAGYKPGRLSDGAAMPGAWKDYKWGWQRTKGF